MQQEEIQQILRGLRSRQPQQPWAKFLELYSPLILQVIRFFERDADRQADCFLFVCEQLTRKRFRRLRRFRLQGPASFPTWLRAVLRNLCLDWHRKEFGRERIFQSVARLPVLEQEIFRLVYEEGLAVDEAYLVLHQHFPHLTREQMAEGLDRIQQSLTARQRWLLTLRQRRIESLDVASINEQVLQEQLADDSPDPEALAALSERRVTLARALGRLAKPERLLLRLRFEQGLTLAQLARITRLGDPQRVDRRIKEILKQLHEYMS